MTTIISRLFDLKGKFSPQKYFDITSHISNFEPMAPVDWGILEISLSASGPRMTSAVSLQAKATGSAIDVPS
jgi:hypothetical protein